MTPLPLMMAGGLLLSAVAFAHPDLPGVPASVLTVPDPQPDPPVTDDRPTLVMTPGVNQLVPVALGHLNRIVTPFAQPRVNTTSQASTEVRDQVIYVAPSEPVPVTLFITEEDSEQQALSLTLIPKRIPARELVLTLAPGLLPAGNRPTGSKAAHWEQQQPYIQRLRDLFRHLALGKVPPGYRLDPVVSPSPVCRQGGLTFDFRRGQTVTGHRLRVQVGLMTNTSGQVLEFVERHCGAADVLAVTSWPYTLLEPGQSAEVYVARRGEPEPPRQPPRPSLLPPGGTP